MMRRILAGLLIAAALPVAMAADAQSMRAEQFGAESPKASAKAVTSRQLILRSQGLSIIGPGLPVPIRATFDASRAEAIRMVTSIRGPATKSGTIEDCGQGTPMDFVTFKGLQLYFVDGKFVGWYIDEPVPPAPKTVKGIGVGSTRAAFRAAYPTATIEQTSLGTEYDSDDAGSGVFDNARPNAKISTMWAGQTCIAR